jgi:hypothetical protein
MMPSTVRGRGGALSEGPQPLIKFLQHFGWIKKNGGATRLPEISLGKSAAENANRVQASLTRCFVRRRANRQRR